MNGVNGMYYESRQKYLTHKINTYPEMEKILNINKATLQSKMNNIMQKLDRNKASILVHLNGRSVNTPSSQSESNF